MHYRIEQLKYEQVLPLRQKVLRPLLRPEDCVYPEDKEITTFHVGLYYSDQLISVSTMIYQSAKDLNAGCPYRLRGMATEEKYRGQGYGEKVLQAAIDILLSKRCDLVWCNARLKAFSFYERFGFKYQGELFEIPEIGPHKVMYKQLIPR